LRLKRELTKCFLKRAIRTTNFRIGLDKKYGWCVDLCEKNSKFSKNYIKFDKFAKIEKTANTISYLILGG